MVGFSHGADLACTMYVHDSLVFMVLDCDPHVLGLRKWSVKCLIPMTASLASLREYFSTSILAPMGFVWVCECGIVLTQTHIAGPHF